MSEMHMLHVLLLHTVNVPLCSRMLTFTVPTVCSMSRQTELASVKY